MTNEYKEKKRREGNRIEKWKKVKGSGKGSRMVGICEWGKKRKRDRGEGRRRRSVKKRGENRRER